MHKHIIAIGGGGFGRSQGKMKIEKYIKKLSKSKHPRVCFIPTATGDNSDYKVGFYKTFSDLGCKPSHIDLFKRTTALKDHIYHQDIIYVGGGNTRTMLAVWKEWGLDIILKKAYNRGVIMSGVSAGAICWFEKGITDSIKSNLSIMNCLGIVNGTCCPHYDEEKERIPYVKSILKKKIISNCIAIEGNSALHIIDGKHFKNISFGVDKNSYTVSIKNKELKEIPFKCKNI